MPPPESGMKINSRREEGQTFIAGHPLARPGRAMIGVIGGSGLASLTLLTEPRDTFTVTPHGAPSGPVVHARHGDVKVAFVARHGPGHKIPPMHVIHRANQSTLSES